MSPLTKSAPAARSRRIRAKALPYGIKARPLPAGHATARGLRGHADEVGKSADWGAIKSAYESRNP